MTSKRIFFERDAQFCSAHTREGGNPVVLILGPRFRGDERGMGSYFAAQDSMAKSPPGCYVFAMTAKTNRKPEPRSTTMVPVTTMEELPVLSDDERDKLLADLKAAEAEIASGHYTELDAEAFRQRLLDIYRNKAR